MRSIKWAAAVLLAAGAIGVGAGCGGGDGDDTTVSEPATTAADTTATAATVDTTATADTTADTTETTADTTADTTDTAGTTTGGGSGDLITPDAAKQAVEGAAGITLSVQQSTPGGSTVYTNAGTAASEGAIAIVYVEENEQAAKILADNPPQLPIPGGRATTFFYKNVFVAYAPITGDDKGAAVQSAVEAL